MEKCIHDRLVIFDGNSEAAPILRVLCGTHRPYPVISSTSDIYILFIGDGHRLAHVQELGFRLSYQFIDPLPKEGETHVINLNMPVQKVSCMKKKCA